LPETSEPDYRFTLANERTFLAYERTAVGLAAAGLAAVQLLDEGWSGRLLGLLLLLAGATVSIGGYLRYRRVEAAIRAGEPLPRTPVPALLSVALVVCLVVAAVTIVL
jgi:putative membrane protein